MNRSGAALPIAALLATLLAILWIAPGAARAEQRVALVIGNGAYETVPQLANPVADARAMAATLERLGFKVFEGFDLDKIRTQETVAKFARAVRGADVAALFYAGHGMQVDGHNYLIPVDAHLEDETALDFEAVSLDFVLRQMSRQTKTRLVFLDACRNNPLVEVMKSSGGRRAASSGLAEVTFDDGGTSTLIAFATSPGEVAYDGAGDHSPFSAALLAHLEAENTPLTTLMTRVTGDVYKATGGMQRPWVNVSLTDEIVLNPSTPTPTPAAVAALPDADSTGRSTGDFAEEPGRPADEIALDLLRRQIPALPDQGPITFDRPIAFGDETLDGRSLAQLIQGKPRFPPIEGLPPEVWDHSCTNCHEWTKARLCEQSATYETLDVTIMRLPHPYGSRFKVALQQWAQNGCK